MISDQNLSTSILTVATILLVCACTATDLRSRSIPNPLLAAGLGIAFLCHGIGYGAPALLTSLAGMLLGGAMLLPFYVLGGIGAGDVKLMAVVGALLGVEGVIIAGIATLLCGGLLGAAWIVWRLIESHGTSRIANASELKRSGISLAPWLAHFNLRGDVFPYAPAIAAGTFIAIWQTGLLGPVAG